MQFAGKIKALFLHFFEWRYEMRIAYVRVSTEEQNEARQREALKQYRIEKWFCEKRSAKDTNRPQLEAMLEFARSGDTIYIHDFSRLARNTQDLLRLGKLMLTMIAAINEFERSILLERQKEGIAIAKREKRYQGRKRIQQPDSFELLYGRYRDHKVTKSEIARQLEISRPTVDRLIKEMETGHKGKS